MLVANTRSYLLAQCGCGGTTIGPGGVLTGKRGCQGKRGYQGDSEVVLIEKIEEVVEGVDGFDCPIWGRPVVSRALILLECGVTIYS